MPRKHSGSSKLPDTLQEPPTNYLDAKPIIKITYDDSLHDTPAHPHRETNKEAICNNPMSVNELIRFARTEREFRHSRRVNSPPPSRGRSPVARCRARGSTWPAPGGSAGASGLLVKRSPSSAGLLCHCLS